MKWLFPSLALLLVTTVPADDKPWTKVAPRGGKCEMEFPAPPRETQLKTGVQLLLEIDNGKAGYMLRFDQVGGKLDIADKDAVTKFFDARRKLLVDAVKGRNVKSTDTTHGPMKLPARDLEMEAENLPIYRVRLVVTTDSMSQPTMYQLTAGGSRAFIDGPDVKKFIESFRLTD